MYTVLKAKYISEDKNKVRILNESYSKLKEICNIDNDEFLEKVYSHCYYKFIEHFNMKEIVPGTNEFIIFEGFLTKSIRLSNSIKEATTTSDVAVFTPPLGAKPQRRKLFKQIPTFECTWKEFKYFIKDNVNKDKSQEDFIKDLLKDVDVDEEFKMELLKAQNDSEIYLKYMDYLVKMAKKEV